MTALTVFLTRGDDFDNWSPMGQKAYLLARKMTREELIQEIAEREEKDKLLKYIGASKNDNNNNAFQPKKTIKKRTLTEKQEQMTRLDKIKKRLFELKLKNMKDGEF